MLIIAHLSFMLAASALAGRVTEAGRHPAWFHQWTGLIALMLTGLAVLLVFTRLLRETKHPSGPVTAGRGGLSGLTVLSAPAPGLMMIGIL